MDNLLTIPLNANAGSLQAYIQATHQYPMLSEARERELAERFHRDNDLEAARELVMSHLRFVVRIARGYAGYGLAQADLIQEGNIGLMKAVKRFDPSIGVRLVSFAVHWIRAEIHEFVLRNWRIVKVATTKPQRKLFFNLRGAKKRLGWLNRAEVDDVARDLGVKPEEVLEMEQRLSAHDSAFDLGRDDNEDAPVAPATYLQDNRFEPSALVEAAQDSERMHERLGHALATLDERSREILQRRWLTDDKSTLQELADRFGVSAERIRQLEKNAIGKLRQAMS